MSDIERYLSELRSHLTDLDPRRADEIVAETRSHLAAEAAKLRTLGASPEDAEAEAVRAFGDPIQLAVRLTAANSRHSSTGAFRTLASVAILWGTIFAVFIGRDVWERLPIHLLATLGVLVAPAAVVAGMVVGPRRWWIAGLAPALLYGVFVLALAWAELLAGRWQWEDSLGVLLALSVALAAGAFSFLGARARITERLKYWVRVAAVVYFLGISIVAITGLRDTVSLFAVIAVVEAAAGLLALTVLWEKYRWRSWILWAGGLLLFASVASMIVWGTYRPFQPNDSEAQLYWMKSVLGETIAWIMLLTFYGVSRSRGKVDQRAPNRC